MKKMIAWIKKRSIQDVIIFLVVGFCLLFIADKVVTNIVNRWKLETYAQTEGTVISCTKLATTAQGRSLRTGAGSIGSQTYYVSTIQYSVDGETYILQDSESNVRKTVGTRIPVFYNPQKPADSLLKQQIESSENRIFAHLLPLLFIAVLVGLIILLEVICNNIQNRRKKIKNEKQF